ncbi:MAG: hypothetical protein ACOC44_18670 [Promethearchaeia archaeon]
MNTEIYNQLIQIEQLQWFPWVGDNYFSLPKGRRLMIVGESHYLDDDSKEKYKASKEKLNNRYYLRERLIPEVINRNYKHWEGNHGNMYPYFHKMLFKNDKFNASAFYNLISFHTFIQRPMGNNRKRPSKFDIVLGWKVFFNLMDILQPTTCLFIGVNASNFLRKAAKEFHVELDQLKKHEKISSTFPRTSRIKKNESFIKTIFIQHSSRYFSWKKWNHFLHNQMNEQIEWLKDEIQY